MPHPPERKAFDRLTDDARIKGETRLVPDGAKPESVSRELAERVIAAVRAYQASSGLKWKEIARAIGLNSTTLSQLVNRLFPANWQEYAIDLDKWLEDELKRQRAPRPTEFVRLRIAEAVHTVAEVAIALKGIGLVYGWSGIGKTTALLAIAADKPGSVFVSAKTAVPMPMGILQGIAAGIGLRDSYNDNLRGLTARLEQLLKGTPRLIIVDEIHKLCGTADDKALHVLRDLYDETGVPMLWSGTIDLVRYLDRGKANGREPLAQIRSRICVARDLSDTGGGDGGGGGDEPLYTIDEIRKVFARSKMRLAPDAARYLFKLANLPDSGALRTCRNLVVIATKINGAAGDVLTAQMLMDAHQLLVSRRDFSTVKGSMRETPAEQMVKVG